MKFRNSTIQKICLTSSILMALLFGLVGIGSVQADINPMLNFAGKVTNLDGSEIADGTYDFSFGLYASSTGGTALWSETQNAATMFSATVNGTVPGTSIPYTGDVNANTLQVGQYLTDSTLASSSLIVAINTSTKTITIADSVAWNNNDSINNRPYVTGGVIDTNYGIVDNSITSVDFNQPLYLEVTFNGETMQPRKLLSAVPYAFNAMELNGKTSDQFVNTVDNMTITGAWTFDNIVNIVATSSSAALSVTQNGTGNIVEFKTATTTALAVLNNGQVQIGNYYFPLARGSNGDVLQTDGSGNLFWGPVAGTISVEPGTAGQVAYYDSSGSIVSGTSSLYLAPNGKVGIGSLSPNVLLQVGSSTPSHVSGYNDTFLSGALETNGLLYVNGAAASIFAGSITATGGINAGGLVVNSSGVVTSGTWQGGTIDVAHGGTGSTTLSGLLKGNGSSLTTAIPGVDYANPGTCPAGEYATQIGSTLVCATPSGTTYSAGGSLLQLVGTTFSLHEGTLASGQGCSYDGTNIVCNTAFITLNSLHGDSPITYNSATGHIGLATVPVANGGTGATSFTNGSIIFYDSSGSGQFSQNNNNLIWNNSSNQLGVGTSSLYVGSVITAGGDIALSGNLVPIGSSTVGTAGNWFQNGYFDTISVRSGINVASTSISGTGGNTFTINSGNATNDAMDSTLAFFRGSGNASPPSDATLTWDSTNKRFKMNFPLFIWDGTNSGPATLTVQAGNGQGNQPLLQWQNNSGSTLGLIGANGYLGLGTSTATALLTVGATSSSQFLVDANGNVIQGVWHGSPIGVAYGGTGTTTYSTNSLLYASAPQTIGEIYSSTTPGLILQLNTAGKPVWSATNTLGINFNTIQGTLSTDQGGTGWNSTGQTGFAYINNGSWGASNTISVANGGTGTTTFQSGSLVYASANNTLGEILAGNDQYILQMQGGTPTWVATNTLAINGSDLVGTVPVKNGGTGSSTLSGLLKGNGTNPVQTAVLGTDYINNAYLSASSPLTYSNGVIGLDSSYTIPLTTSVNSWNSFYNTPSTRLTAGTGLSWSSNTLNANNLYVNTGNQGEIGYYAGAATSTLTATSTLFITPAGWVGVGSTTPMSMLAVNGWITAATSTGGFCIGSSCINSWSSAGVGQGGTVTSVNMTVPTGLTISGNPITNSGTLALGLDTLYTIPLLASTTNWNNFYNTPSTRLTAGTGLSWSSNTLNANNLYVNTGNQGEIGYYAGAATSTLTATSTLFITPAGWVGVGSTTPMSMLAVNGWITAATSTGGFCIGSSCINSWSSAGVGQGGTVTSVNMTVPTGLTISGNPITNSGTLALGLDTLYTIPLLASTTNWNNFYNTPSTRLTAGTGLSWSSNTLNANNLYVNTGNQGEIGYYAGAATSTLTATSTLFITPAGWVGVGSTTPMSMLAVNGWITAATSTGGFCIGSSCINSWSSAGVGQGGTVTSVNMTVPTGLTISGNPITNSGTLALGLDTLYTIPLLASTTNWNNFYNTPSTRLTAGTGLSWSSNTLNANNLYVNTGNQGEIGYYAGAATSTLTATSTLFITPAGWVGVGSTTPMSMLAVNGWITAATSTGGFCIGSSCINSWSSAGVGQGGTVTSVNMTVPTGLTISGNPITNSGTLALGLDTLYTIPLLASTTNWNNFYNTPSTRLTAGTGLSWSSNTLNANNLYVNTGNQGEIGYYAGAATSTLTATSTLFITPAGWVGVGSTTPMSMLAVNGWITAATSTGGFCIGSSCINSWAQAGISILGTPLSNQLTYWNSANQIAGASSLSIDSTGDLGVGTTSPSALLTVGATSSQQFLVNNIGQVTAGTWNGSTIGVGYGGTGIISATAGYAIIGNSATALQATSTMFISPTGYVGIGTTSPTALLTVGANSSQQFIVNNIGQITQGTWNGTTISAAYGGTGTTTFSAGTMLYASAANTWSALASSSDGSILWIGTNGYPAWIGTSSLGISFSGVGGTASNSQGGTGWNSSGASGMVQVVGGTWGAVTGTANNLAFWSDANTVAATSTLYLTPSGYLGIGTTTPLAALGMNGDIYLQGANHYINFGTSTLTAANGYGFRDNNGTMQYKNSGGTWVNIGSAGSAGALGSLSGVSISNATTGSAFIYDGANWVNTAYAPFALLGTSTASASAFTNYLLYWNGNSFATSSFAYNGIQTTFYSNGVQSMVLDANGNLAIGTSTAAASTKLTVMSADGAQLRLANSTNAYADFTVSPSGMLTIKTSATSSSELTVGDGTANKDASFVLNGFYGSNQQYYHLAFNHLNGNFEIGSGELISSSSLLAITSTGLVGIGTNSPSVLFQVGSSTPTNVTGYNDAYVSGNLEAGGLFYVDGTGTSTMASSLNLAGALRVGGTAYISGNSNGITVGKYSAPVASLSVVGLNGGIPFDVASSTGTSLFRILGNGNVGIGTTTPGYLLTVNGTESITNSLYIGTPITSTNYANNLLMMTGNVAGYLQANIQNQSNGATSSSDFVATANDGSDSSYYVDMGINSSGYSDSSFTITGAHDAYLYNSDGALAIGSATTSPAGVLKFFTGGTLAANERMRIDVYGNVAISTTTPQATLSVQGLAGGIPLDIASSTGTSLFRILGNGNVGIGTTTPQANLVINGTTGNLFQVATSTNQNIFAISSNGYIGVGTSTPSAPLAIYSTAVAGTGNVIYVATGTSGAIFRVNGNGAVYGDGAAYNSGADYAEYFYTTSTNLQRGDLMCMDVVANNQVKRCDRGEDANVIGIVSTKPAVVGNYKQEYENNSNYIIVGLIGQIPAKVSTENGPIMPGDSLTPASSTPGYAMKANPGDPTVGVALEELDGNASTTNTGVINVLIARQNKSLTVETVEAQVTQQIANLQIQDEVEQMLKQTIDNYDLNSKVVSIVTNQVNEQINEFDQALTVKFDNANNAILNIAAGVDSLNGSVASLLAGYKSIANRLATIENWKEGTLFDQLAQIASTTQVMTVTQEGNIRVGDINDYSTSTPDVAVVDIETGTTTSNTALVINQKGQGDVADFQASGVSIVNIAETGRVTIVGEMMVDGRIMVCPGGACGNNLDNAVDETLGDIGVQGTVVAGAFASYCEDGYTWVPGSSKYGTMPGFCVESDLAKIINSNEVWTNVAQGEAQLACQGLGDGYHLLTENEWMTLAENIIRVKDNNISGGVGLVLATSTDPRTGSTTISYVLSNGNVIYNLVGTIAEWTDQTVPKTGLVEPLSADWQEYYGITDYKGLNIAPPYYYNADNGIGKIKTGDGNIILAGFVRGTNGIYSLDLSNSPTTATSTIGFRCAK